MKKQKTLVVANWKMNPETPERAKEIFQATKRLAENLKKVQVVVCPPYVYLSDLGKTKLGKLELGAQDVFWEKEGPFTGEISPVMLKRSGENYVIIGHSERRELGETDDIIARKLKSATTVGLQTILCVGEKSRDDHGEYLHFLRAQLTASLFGLQKKNLEKIIIAYEPVWAIGKDVAMGPLDVHETMLFIRKVLAEIYGPTEAMNVPILYGGSVNQENAKELITLGEVQGLLVGRESLSPKRFAELLKNVD